MWLAVHPESRPTVFEETFDDMDLVTHPLSFRGVKIDYRTVDDEP